MRPRGAAAGLVALLALGAAVARADDVGPSEPGAYCPIPKPGDPPRCLEPAIAEYGEFFDAVEQGRLEDEQPLSRVEGELEAGTRSGAAYLALSSLAYGYYRLSLRAAATPDVDPAIAARLERWNAILAQAYDAAGDDEAFRGAVREAALDLRRNAPPIGLVCRDARGAPVACDSTDAVLRGLDSTADDVGIRGGLERLLERILGGDHS